MIMKCFKFLLTITITLILTINQSLGFTQMRFIARSSSIYGGGTVSSFVGTYSNISTDGQGAAAHFTGPFGATTDSSGNIYIGDNDSNSIRKITPGGLVSTLAGYLIGPGSTDATGASARFNNPLGTTVDALGNVYIADSSNQTIRKITSTGVVTTFVGTAGVIGSADGTGVGASFNYPFNIVADTLGNLYVTDTGNNTIRKIVISTGVVTTLAGTAGVIGSTNATGAAASFKNPEGVTIDSSGNLYIADRGNNTIRKIVISTGVVTTLAGTAGVIGSTNATGAAASFNAPYGITTDLLGNLYVSDTINEIIRKIVISTGVVTTFAGTAGVIGSADGTGAAASFYYPMGITFSSGVLYIGDTYNNNIRKIVISTGVVNTLAGVVSSGQTDGTGTSATFFRPVGVSVDSSGNIYVADSQNNVIRKVSSSGVTSTLAGTLNNIGSVNGIGSAAKFKYPSGVSIDSSGNLYVADAGNNTIRKIIISTGVVTTLAGTAGVIGSVDGTGAAASFFSPLWVTSDTLGNLFVADLGNCTIRKIVISTGVVSTFAGTPGICGFANGTGAAAKFISPGGIAIDTSNNMYVTDTDNYVIRKITSAGVVSTFAGTTGIYGSTDGTGAAASFKEVSGISIDMNGNLYVSDLGNATVRKIVISTGVVSTFAGTSGVQSCTTNGKGPAASFNYLQGITNDSSGNAYVADQHCGNIRKITP
jgi:hypothetical protein